MNRAALFALMFLCLGLAAGAIFSARLCRAAEGAEARLDALAGMAARIQTLEARFRQTRYVAFMDEELVSEGFFSFRKPDELIWQYDSPVLFRLEYKRGRAVIAPRPGEGGPSASREEAELAALFAGRILPWISLDMRSIQAGYSVSLLSDAPLTLRFMPRESGGVPPQSIQLTFAGNDMDVREVLLRDGESDFTRLEFSGIRRWE